MDRSHTDKLLEHPLQFRHHLTPSPETLFWDFEEDDERERWTVIRDGAKEIWRELSAFENYLRFGEVAAILKEKYVDLQDLVSQGEESLDSEQVRHDERDDHPVR